MHPAQVLQLFGVGLKIGEFLFGGSRRAAPASAAHSHRGESGFLWHAVPPDREAEFCRGAHGAVPAPALFAAMRKRGSSPGLAEAASEELGEMSRRYPGMAVFVSTN